MARKLAIIALVAFGAALSVLTSRPAAAFDPVQVSGLGQPAFVLSPTASYLDPTFGSGGKVLTDFGHSDAIEDLAIQSDGKIVAVGQSQDLTLPFAPTHFALSRYKRNGSLDASFGTAGKVTSDFGGYENRAFAVALQPDGKIVAAGVTSGGPTGADIALARYNGDGTLDTSFGVGGKAVTDFSSTHEGALGIAIQANGQLVVVGNTRPFGGIGTNPPDFALARYKPNGSLDSGFDGDGKVSTGFTPGWEDRGQGVAIAPDGKIVAAGYAFNRLTSEPGVIDVARYNADGSLDASFDGDGKLVTSSNSGSAAYGVVVQPDGKIVVAGFHEQKFALVGYTAGGALDPTFGTGGVGTAEFGTKQAWARALVRQPDGKLVAAGLTRPVGPPPWDSSFAVARFDRSGKLDTSFYGGAVSTDFGAMTFDEARGLALQADGKIVLGGISGPIQNGQPVGEDFALARYPAPQPLCRVPNVRGKKLPVARSAITKARCSVGKVKRQASKKVKSGRVISQSPKAGKSLPNRSKVNLVVSRGRR